MQIPVPKLQRLDPRPSPFEKIKRRLNKGGSRRCLSLRTQCLHLYRRQKMNSNFSKTWGAEDPIGLKFSPPLLSKSNGDAERQDQRPSDKKMRKFILPSSWSSSSSSPTSPWLSSSPSLSLLPDSTRCCWHSCKAQRQEVRPGRPGKMSHCAPQTWRWWRWW